MFWCVALCYITIHHIVSYYIIPCHIALGYMALYYNVALLYSYYILFDYITLHCILCYVI